MFEILRHLARALLPAWIRKPIADRAYGALAWWRNVVARWRNDVAQWRNDVAQWRNDAAKSAGSHHVVPGVDERARRYAARLVTASRGLLGAGKARLLQTFVTSWLPLVWARPPLTRSQSIRQTAVRALLSVSDAVLNRRYTALLTHARRPRPLLRGGPRRVCLAIGTLGPGGAERQATNTLVGVHAEYAAELEVLVTYLDHDWQTFFAPEIGAAGIPVRALARGPDPIDWLSGCGHADAPSLASAIAAALPRSLHDVALYAREFLLRQPDIVHLWLDEVNVRAGLGAVLAGVPRIVLSTRSLNPSHFMLFQPYMRAGYRVLTARDQVVLLNNSQAGARDYERWIGLKPGTCTVLRNGFDFDALLPPDPAAARAATRRRLGIRDDAIVVGGVMRFSEEKRPLFWLDTAELVLREHPDTLFLLVGDGVLREAVHARVAHSPLAGSAILPGHDTRAYDTMNAMDLLFLSSIHEGLPNVLIEAQALGVPVVTTPAGGASETLADGLSGWVVRGTDPPAAARVIASAIADRARLRAAGEHGRSFVRHQFGYQRLVYETVGIYGDLPRRPVTRSAGGNQSGVGVGDQ